MNINVERWINHHSDPRPKLSYVVCLVLSSVWRRIRGFLARTGHRVCGRASAVARTRTGQRLGLTAGITRAAVLLAEARGRISRCWAWVGQRPAPTRCSLACSRSALLRKARYGEIQTDCIPQTAEECAWLDGLTEEQFGRMLVAWCDKDLRIGIGQWISAGY